MIREWGIVYRHTANTDTEWELSHKFSLRCIRTSVVSEMNDVNFELCEELVSKETLLAVIKTMLAAITSQSANL